MKNKASLKSKIYRKLHWILFARLKPGSAIRWWYPAYRHGIRMSEKKKQANSTACVQDEKLPDTVYLTQIPNDGAGIGHQMANYIGGVHYARIYGVKHAHSGFKDADWERFLGFGENEITVTQLLRQGYHIRRLPYFDEEKDRGLIQNIIASYQGQKILLLTELDQFYQKQYEEIPYIKDKFEHAAARAEEENPFDEQVINIALHIRRGDIVEGQTTGEETLTKRWLTMDYYENVVKSLLKEQKDGSLIRRLEQAAAYDKQNVVCRKLLDKLKNRSDIVIHIFSQGKEEDYKCFESYGKVDYCLNMDARKSFLCMVRADILVTSKSSFSYKPALLADGIRICPPGFWHGYPDEPQWIVTDAEGNFTADRKEKVAAETEENEDRLPQDETMKTGEAGDRLPQDETVEADGNLQNGYPLVSLILPVYNVQRYLPDCLDSILAQTYPWYEVLLVDDGSTDDSRQIAEMYEAKDSRFHVIHQENKGLASARNTGLAAMQGEFFYFIDSDDCIHPQLLETAVSVMEQKKANLVQLNLKSVPADYSSFGKEESVHYEESQLQHFTLVEALYNLDRDNQKLASDIRLTTTVVWTKLYRTKVFQNFRFPEGMRMHEDQMVSHRLLQMAGDVWFLNLPLYFYRQSDASLIRVGWTPKRLAILDCYEDRLRCCEEVASDGTQTGAEGLKNYMLERYLVCCFRNYDMVCQKLSGVERRKTGKEILHRMQMLLQSDRARLGRGKKLFFRLFVLMPDLFIKVFQLRNKIRK